MTTGTPHVTVCVVIPALDVAGAVRAAASFAAEADEVVIVDNGAAIDTRELPPRTSLVRPPGNIGYGAAANLVAARTTADVLLVTNDDVVAEPQCVRRLAAAFADPAVDHAGGVLWTVDGRIDSAGIAVDRSLRSYDVRHLDGDRPSPAPIAASGAVTALRRTTFLALGGFAPELFAYWEDVDLALRLHSRGARFAFVADAHAVHERGTALGGRSLRQRELDAFGRGFVLGRYRSWLGPVDRIAVLLVDLPSTLRGVLGHRSTSTLRQRRRGRAAGRAAAAVAPSRRAVATRGVRDTLRRQWGSERSAL